MNTPLVHVSYYEPNLTDKQKRILNFLEQRTGEVAKIYKAGLILLSDEMFPARVYLLAHVLREIRNRLPDYFGISSRGRVPHVELIEGINEVWETSAATLSVARPDLTAVTPNVSIPPIAFLRIDELLQRHKESQYARRQAFQKLLASRDVTGATYPEPVIRQWLDLPLDKMAHLRGADQTPPSIDECIRCWYLLEDTLHAIVAPMHKSVEVLDEFIKEANA